MSTAQDATASHGTRFTYLLGFTLSVILTAIPFWLVMNGTLGSQSATAVVIVALAFVQIVVHMVYFLHMNGRAEGGWSIMALGFTVLVIVIALSGSIWVMLHLNANMMPGSQDMGQMP